MSADPPRPYSRICWLEGNCLFRCDECGAVIVGRDKHDEWHAKIEVAR